MATQPRTIQPPLNELPLADTGNHTAVWQAYYQGIADRLTELEGVKKGAIDGSDAAAGDVGEYLSATGGAVALTNNASGNVVSLDLPAGDWDVSGNVSFTIGTGTHNYFAAGIGAMDVVIQATYPSSVINMVLSTRTARVNVTATTTVWVVAQAGFTGTVSATGAIRARRMR